MQEMVFRRNRRKANEDHMPRHPFLLIPRSTDGVQIWILPFAFVPVGILGNAVTRRGLLGTKSHQLRPVSNVETRHSVRPVREARRQN
jgi:hypothetical protein